jgi:polar amino acid transport system substrate-binding protein
MPRSGVKCLFKSVILIISGYLSLCVAAVGEPLQENIIKVAIVDWCPQICPDKEPSGYITEIVSHIFSTGPYQLEFHEYPWTRGIMEVRAGKLHALLAPTREEAPNLLFPENKVGVQKMCFFRRTSDEWQYTGIESLRGLRIGMVNDVYIEEIDQYKRENEDQFKISSYYDGKYIQRSLRMLKAGRLDTFLFTYNSTSLEIRQEGLTNSIVSAGCFYNTNVYMAFSPAEGLSDSVAAMMAHYDRGIKAMWRDGGIQTILRRYQLGD